MVAATATVTEDDIYRCSTQYRLWSFTPESLATLRATTNASAIDSVRAAYRASAQGKKEHEVDCLTVEEEQKLVGFYCVKAMQLADFCEFPTNVKATAVQYLKRFYLSNSPMTYHPKEIMPSALFLSTKTENHYTSLKSFVAKLPKTTAEDVIAPEFLLTQGLRFTFDVRHPQRGLEGGFMEMISLARGVVGTTIQQEMLSLDPVKAGGKKSSSADELVQRIQAAHGKAKEILKTSALLTDVYFHYTPAQIWLTAYSLADSPLSIFYINHKLPSTSAVKARLMSTLQECQATLLAAPSANPTESELKMLTKIDKKLYQCRNPEKIDLVGINKAQKRDGDNHLEPGMNEKAYKKRKTERQQSKLAEDDIFGPSLNEAV